MHQDIFAFLYVFWGWVALHCCKAFFLILRNALRFGTIGAPWFLYVFVIKDVLAIVFCWWFNCEEARQLPGELKSKFCCPDLELHGWSHWPLLYYGSFGWLGISHSSRRGEKNYTAKHRKNARHVVVGLHPEAAPIVPMIGFAMTSVKDNQRVIGGYGGMKSMWDPVNHSSLLFIRSFETVGNDVICGCKIAAWHLVVWVVGADQTIGAYEGLKHVI